MLLYINITIRFVSFIAVLPNYNKKTNLSVFFKLLFVIDLIMHNIVKNL